MFAVLGTFISALVFGLCTYLLVLLGIVRRSHLAGSPFVECLAYGGWGGVGWEPASWGVEFYCLTGAPKPPSTPPTAAVGVFVSAAA